MKTQVAIIGGGPSGLLLSQLLYTRGIDSVVLERKTRDYVLGRIRAGVLERGTVDLLREAGCADRLERESLTHNGAIFCYDNDRCPIRFTDYIDRPVTVYGQTEVTRDLYDAREAAGGNIVFDVEDVQLNDIDSTAPTVSYRSRGQGFTVDCDFIVGCDGFHGVSRSSIPPSSRREYEKVYPFGWIGVLSQTPPINAELIYSNSPRGFALCSMRSEQLSRYYMQCPASDADVTWPDDVFWDELRRRLPEADVDALVTGPSIEKSFAPLRSFVCEPMRFGSLFLCGDAAHIVPPTGAKGLNTAASDVHYLFNGLRQYYEERDTEGIARYSERALERIWKTERFSWWLTALMHRFPDQGEFDGRMQRAEFEFLRDTPSAQAALAINYVGLPY